MNIFFGDERALRMLLCYILLLYKDNPLVPYQHPRNAGQTIYTQYYVKTLPRGGQKYYRKNKNEEKKIEFNQT